MNHLYKNLGQITLNLILKREIKMRTATVIKMLQMLFTTDAAQEIPALVLRESKKLHKASSERVLGTKMGGGFL